jgi:glutamine cyclotransferase
VELGGEAVAVNWGGCFWLALLVVLVICSGCMEQQETPAPSPTPSALNYTPVYSYEIVNVYPHDPAAYTQGLVFADGVLYEGTGLYGASGLRQVELATGSVLQEYRLPTQYFGEGITLWNDALIQITYQSHRGFVYDKESFARRREFSYPTDGWGITHDGEHLIMSDGTATLYFLDPGSFEPVKQLEVTDRGTSIAQLNELEYVQGTIYANVWPTNRIAMISPETGDIVGWIELTGLLSAEYRLQPVDVLNGIAYDAVQNRLFVTGKYWPKLFEIELKMK